MKKLDMLSADMTQQQLHALRTLFPHCVTEAYDAHGQVTLKVDFDLLKQELSPVLIDAQQERYQLNWPGKRQAIVAANTPIAKTLRPVPAESVDFDNTQHLFIEGDNLDALKLLQETYLGKVKLIYIDPPYNTGNDFIYLDNYSMKRIDYLVKSGQVEPNDSSENSFLQLYSKHELNGQHHSIWLSMMYSRLKLARNLLDENGAIFICIDDNEQAGLKQICDEIFGESNLVATFIWQHRKSSQNDIDVSLSHNYILVFAKNRILFRLNPLEINSEKFSNPDSDPRGPWVADPMDAPNIRPNLTYPIVNPNTGETHLPPQGRCWRFSQDKYVEAKNENRIVFGKTGRSRPQYKRYQSEAISKGTNPFTIWTEMGTATEATKELMEFFDGKKLFDTPKPVRLLRECLKLTSFASSNDIILDFFAGSSTTAHAVMQLNAEDGGNRQFIMIQIPEVCSPESEAAKVGFPTIAEISKERIRRAGAQILRDWQGVHHTPATQNFLVQTAPVAPDVGFRVLKIDSSNMHEVFYVPDRLVQGQLALLADNIKPDRTSVDLLFQVMLDWGVELSLPISCQRIGRHDVYAVAGNALVACFDTHIDEELVRALTHLQPLRVVFRDGGFVSDAVKINVGQIFAQLSPLTEVRVI